MSTANKLARGAMWSYGAQLLTVLVQIGYAAVTSRQVSDTGFGAYSVALTATGLFTLIASGGLAQTVGRLRDSDEHELPAIWSYAGLMGAAFGIATFLLAGVVARFWGVDEAETAVQVLALNATCAPIFGVAAGLMRRRGRFRSLAVATLTCNVIGMAVGLVAVIEFKNAQSLVVSSVVAQILLTLAAIWSVRSEIRFGRVSRSNESVGFSGRVIGSSLMQYIIGTAPRFTAANTLGAPAIGQWNRAEVLATLPFQQLQAALVPVVYPEFRHDRGKPSRSLESWADMLALLAWVTVPLGVVASVLLPELIPAMFGKQWESAGQYAIPLALAGGVQPVAILLASGIEALGEFKVIWTANSIILLIQLCLSALVITTHSLWPAVSALLISHVISHVIYTWWASRKGVLDAKRLGGAYIKIVVFSGVAAATVWLVFEKSTHIGENKLLGGIGLAVLAGEVVLALIYWRKFPPLAIAKKWNVLVR